MHLEQVKSLVRVWYMFSWNVRSLVDVEDTLETARQRCDESVVDEQKID